jgi:hypothetical protein
VTPASSAECPAFRKAIRGHRRDVTANDGRSGIAQRKVKKTSESNFVIICPGVVMFWSNHDVASQKDK